MEIRELRFFVAVAEDPSFKAAAERLGVSQSLLSQALSRFEERLGVDLFTRGQRRAPQLTGAGRALLHEARQILAQVDVAESIVRSRSTTSLPVKVAAVSSVFGGLLPRVVPRLRAAHPEVGVTLVSIEEEGLVRAVHDGRVDLAFVRLVAPSENYTLLPLATEPLMCALPSDHPLAGEPEVDLAALADEDFALFRRSMSRDGFDGIIGACQRAGFSPRITTWALDDIVILSAVSCGLGVSLMPYQSSMHAFPGVTFVPVAQDWARTTLSVITPVDTPSPAVDRLVEVARAEIADIAFVDGRAGRPTFRPLGT
jgi:DNA-binding transcriptional LysR family regulator